MINTAILHPVTVFQVRTFAPEYGASALTKYKLGVRKDGVLYWQAVRHVAISTNKQSLQRRCYRYNKREGVPTFRNVRNGGRLTSEQCRVLVNRGFLRGPDIIYREVHHVIS